MIELFADKYVIHQINDIRLLHLREALQFFSEWYEETLPTKSKKEFILDKLWFDLNSMVLGFCRLVRIKLRYLPGSVVKPCTV